MFWKKKPIVELQPFQEFIEECRLKALCFTGHRSQKLPWRFNEKDPRTITYYRVPWSRYTGDKAIQYVDEIPFGK